MCYNASIYGGRMMGRIFWKALTEKRLDDGRLLLDVEFEEKSTGDVHRWTPKWAHMLELTHRAYEVEVANETNSPYQPLLDAARNVRVEEQPRVEETPVRGEPQREPYAGFCVECDVHVVPVECCYFCDGDPYRHQ